MTRALLFTALLLPQMYAQQPVKDTGEPEASQPPTIRLLETVYSRAEAGGMIMGPFRCDAEGNAYFRRYFFELPGRGGPIQKINSRGESVASFSYQAAGIPNLAGYDFALTKEGDIWQLGWKMKGKDEERTVYLLHFQKDGTFDKAVPLESRFIPTGSLVPLSSGNFLVSAIAAPVDRKPTSQSFTGIFGADGKLVKQIKSFESDEQYLKELEADEHNKMQAGLNTSISGGDAVVGSDGRVYLLRRTSPATILVLEGEGQLAATWKVPSGASSPMFAASIAEHQGRLAIMFKNHGPGETKIKVIDMSTGEEFAAYDADPSLGAALACYDGNRFTFLSSKDNKLTLRIAGIQ